MKKKKGFTLVELLAVIVILAVILIIAVPRITDVINNSKKASFESSAKTIASQAEKKYMEQQVLGNTDTISCSDIANINSTDYASCEINFDASGNAKITLIGKGKFEGLQIINGTKDKMSVTLETDSTWFTYKDVVGGIAITGYTAGMNADITIKDKDACVSYLVNSSKFVSIHSSYTTEEITEIAGDICSDPEAIYYFLLDNTIASNDYEQAGIEVKWLDYYVNGGGRDIVIPSYIDGKKVVAIADLVFIDYIKSVIIPNTVTSIGEWAFAGSLLSSVVIPDSVTSIGDYAFYKNKLANVVISKNVTSIGREVFSENQLTNVVIPNGVTSIGDYAFFDNQLTNVVIPSSVTSIGQRAFEIGCETFNCVDSVCTCIKVGGNANLSKIVNKTGKAFDWDLIINSSSKGRYTFVTGDVVSDNKENHIVSIVSE